MTSIASIETATATVPLPASVGFSSRTVTQRDYTLVRVTGDDGVSGIGFCYPGHRAASLATSAVGDLLAPAIAGDDAHLVGSAWSKMHQERLLHGRLGSVMRAISAIDIALWDRNARASPRSPTRRSQQASAGSCRRGRRPSRPSPASSELPSSSWPRRSDPCRWVCRR